MNKRRDGKMTVFLFELKTYRWSLLWWAVGIIALQFIMMIFYPSMAQDAETIDLIIKHYPEELLRAFGMSEQASLATVFGYYTFIFTFAQLLLSIQSAYYGFNFLSTEESNYTADFLYTKPLNRSRIIVEKQFAILCILVITAMVTALSGLSAIELFRDGRPYEAENYWVLMGTIPVFQVFFFSIGMVVSACTKKLKSVIGFALGVAFFFYIINGMRGIIGGDLLGYLTPYYHFEVAYILEEGMIPWNRGMISIFVILLCHGMTYFYYPRKNLPTV